MGAGPKYKAMNKALNSEISAGPGNDCSCYQSGDCDLTLYKFGGISPERTDEEKMKHIKRLDEAMGRLAEMKSCQVAITIGISIVEGTFIKESDHLNPDEFYRKPKGHKLDLKRFLERYKTQLEEAFPLATIYLTVQGW